jgi:hypothetical protein
MKFIATIFIASLVAFVAANPIEDKEPGPRDLAPFESVNNTVEARDTEFDLNRRACNPNKCKCQAPPYLPRTGVYCANCPVSGWPGTRIVYDLGRGGSLDHVYQCNTNGDCCDYGYARDCAGGATGRCGVR